MTAGADLSALTRPSGGFAMLAIDQREALRLMLEQERAEDVSDRDVTEFKLAATRTLTPHASAVLLDKQFVLDRALEEKAVAPGCAVIAAADEFIPGADEVVADTRIDPAVDAAAYKSAGVAALKLLVVYRPDTDPAERVDLVTDFVDLCRAHDLISIVEPVSRAPRSGGEWDWDAGVHAAAKELGDLGADLYKAEVPHRGAVDDDTLRDACADLTNTISSPWVVLSSGVDPDRFPDAVRIALESGASGFLSGRAVWRESLQRDDVNESLRTDAVQRLQRLCAVVDGAMSRR